MIRQLICLHQLITRQAFAVAASSEKSTMAVGTSKKTSSMPSMIMPPAMPKTPDTSEPTKTVHPIAASAMTDMSHLPLPEQPTGTQEINTADREDNRFSPLPKTVIRHAPDHKWRKGSAADGKRNRHQHRP